MAFTAADVKNLREMTGVGMMDCKKALAETDGDMDKAVELLREKGLAACPEEGRPHRRRGHGLRRGLLRRRWASWSRSTPRPTSWPRTQQFIDFVKGVCHCGRPSAGPADMDALMALPLSARPALTVQQAPAGQGPGHRREHQDPPLRPL